LDHETAPGANFVPLIEPSATEEAKAALLAFMAFIANTDCGAGVKDWRGSRKIQGFIALLLLVRTPICNQRAWPLKASGPNSPAEFRVSEK